MNIARIILFIIITSVCSAQVPGNSVVFKVRAPQSGCSIICEDTFFWLETLNPVRIKVTGKNKKTDVQVTGGNIMYVKDDTYYIRFVKPGEGVITVYIYTSKGKEIAAVKKQTIKNPDIFLCGIKLDSTSKRIDFNGTNIYAYSKYFKQNLNVVSFEMYYIEDTTKVRLRSFEPIKMKADTCILTQEMKKTILGFQPKYNEIYFYNIICKAPDGSKRILDPIRLNIERDTTDKENFSLFYTVKKKIFKN